MTRSTLIPLRGDVVRAERLRHCLTGQELADRAGVSLGTVKRAEAGCGASAPTIRKLARALRVSYRVLVAAVDSGKPAESRDATERIGEVLDVT